MEQSKILIYQTDDGHTQIDVRLENDTVWLTQTQMADLFKSSRTNIIEHIQNIYKDGELNEKSTCRKIRQVRQEGKRTVNREITMFNLDMIISVGYKVNSKRGVRFRQWANEVLKQYLIKGYAVNERMRREQIAELRQLVSFWVQEREVFGPPFSCTRRRGRIDLLLVRHSEVVRTGLRLLEDQEQRIAALRTAIEEGMTSGCVEDFDSKVLNNFLELS
jgi:prophage antirepressor-like protein